MRLRVSATAVEMRQRKAAAAMTSEWRGAILSDVFEPKSNMLDDIEGMKRKYSVMR